MRICLIAIIVCLAGQLLQAQTVIRVAPNGNDSQTGSEDAPLATLAGARDRIRSIRPAQPVIVEFAAGTYRFTQPVEFTDKDTGFADRPITYRAAPNAVVHFTGGVIVTDWKPVTDDRILNRLTPDARTHVRVTDLKAQAITVLSTIAPAGFGMPKQPAAAELVYDNKPMTLARWPNEGYRGVIKVIDPRHVVVDTDRMKRWGDEPDAQVFAYWHYDWADLSEPIAAVDAEAHVLQRTDKITPKYGITPGKARWFAFNLLSELDAPGEYYIDRASGLLYFWPPKEEGRAVLSQATGIIHARDLSHVTFQGFIIEACRGTAMQFDDCTSTEVIGCTIRNAGLMAVNSDGGTQDTIYGCDISHCGAGGVSMSGGDRATLSPGEHHVENNHIFDFARRYHTYCPAIHVSGVGNRIAHNLVDHGPHMAISAPGNNNIVEYNEVHHVIQECGDAGAYYVGRDWTQRGTIIRYNYWHDIVGGVDHGMTIYLDDQFCGTTITGNVFENCARAVLVGGGDDNIVTNNVFVNCWRSAHLDNRGMNWQRKMATDPHDTLHTRLQAMPYTSELWRKQYPNLADILQDDPGVPKRNVFARNISAGGKFDDITQSIRKHQTVSDNLAFDKDPQWIMLDKDAHGGLTGIRFKDEDAVRKIGFEPIPVSRIGVYEDARRASWPVSRQEEPP